MLEKSANVSEIRFVSTAAEASFLIQRLPEPDDHTVKAKRMRCYRKLKTWTHNRVKDVWNAERRIRVSSEEMDQLRELTRQKKEEAERDDTADLFRRIAALEHWLGQVDPDFHRATIEGLQQASRPASPNEG